MCLRFFLKLTLFFCFFFAVVFYLFFENQPGTGERNFHIFYFLLTSDVGKQLLNGCNCNDFKYLNNGADSTVKGMNDSKEFLIVEKACQNIGLANEVVHSMWEIMSAILWLGNATFGGDNKKGTKKKHSRQSSVSESKIDGEQKKSFLFFELKYLTVLTYFIFLS